ncbi:MAG: cell division protein ZipA C-terminal FtsZ-binding domain-containing protein [Burkholderiales bacterium]|jgi:FtsZ-interacting cell division protein ZipA|nr:cell division protein ZipA C-terminal FtsZ-binding domain-containing protein [Burkholderiales bacterium]
MSDLQIALAAIGLVVVGGVYAFNIWQERKLRQRLQKAFEGEHADVLLKTAEAEPVERAEPRIEPRIGDEAEPVAAPGPEPAPGVAAASGGADPLIEFQASVNADQPVGDAALRELLSRLATFGKPARVLGRDGGTVWRVLDRGSHAGCRELQVALQLVNRSGPLHAPQLNGFCDALREWAAKHGATVELGDTTVALEAARELDAFCGDMDVAIGVNVVALAGEAFSGEQVAEAAADAGFTLEPDGLFHLHDAAGHTLFTLENHEAEPFSEGHLVAMQTSGLTLLLDVPRIADGVAVLDRMVKTGTALAASLGGQLVDDNRTPLQQAGLNRIRQQLQDIHAAMAAQDIAAGSPRALRLFA